MTNSCFDVWDSYVLWHIDSNCAIWGGLLSVCLHSVVSLIITFSLSVECTQSLLGFRSVPLKYFFNFRHLSLPQREKGNTTLPRQRPLSSLRFYQSLYYTFVFSSFEHVQLYCPYLKEFFCSPPSMTVFHFCWQGWKLFFATAPFIFHSFFWFSHCSEETKRIWIFHKSRTIIANYRGCGNNFKKNGNLFKLFLQVLAEKEKSEAVICYSFEFSVRSRQFCIVNFSFRLRAFK